MVACRVPIVAAVNGPAVGLGCSLVALSDIVYMAESAHLADPHVLIGLVAADGGPGHLAAADQPPAGQGVRADRRPHPGRAGRRDRPGQPRVPRRRGARPGDGLRPEDRRPAPGGGRGHQADPQPAPRAGRAGHPRLRPERRGPVVRLARAAGQPRPLPGQGPEEDRRGLRARRRPARAAGRSSATWSTRECPRAGAGRGRGPRRRQRASGRRWSSSTGRASPCPRPTAARGDGRRAGDRARGAGPGRRPHAVPGHDEPVRAAGARCADAGACAPSCSARSCAGGTGAVAFAADDGHGPAPTATAGCSTGTARPRARRRPGRRARGRRRHDDGVGVFVVPAADVTATRTTTFDGDPPPRRRRRSTASQSRPDRAAVGPERVAGASTRATTRPSPGWRPRWSGPASGSSSSCSTTSRTATSSACPIGSFQAVKHMAVDVYVAIERARALCQFAALDHRRGRRPARGRRPRWPRPPPATASASSAGTASSSSAASATRGRTTCSSTCAGPRSGELLLGSTTEHRARVARDALAAQVDGGGAGMKLHFDDATEAFRQRVRRLARRERARPGRDHRALALERRRPAVGPRVAAQDVRRRLAGARQPARVRRPQRHAARAVRAPARSSAGGGSTQLQPAGPRASSPRRSSPSAPRSRSSGGRCRSCGPRSPPPSGMSEPDAGSDLAGLRTRAVLDGDHFVVNGQKVWTSGAHDADVILAFVRTDPDAPKHRGISCLLVPTDLPGPDPAAVRLDRRPRRARLQRGVLRRRRGAGREPRRRPPRGLAGGHRLARPRAGDDLARLRRAARRPDRRRRRRRCATAAWPTTRSSSTGSGRLVDRRHALRLLGYRTLAKTQRGMEPRRAVDPQAVRVRGGAGGAPAHARGARPRRPRPDRAVGTAPAPPVGGLHAPAGSTSTCAASPAPSPAAPPRSSATSSPSTSSASPAEHHRSGA